MNIEDGATREEVEEALTHQVRAARREFAVVGTAEHPTRWDKAHARIDQLLDVLAEYRTEVPA